MGLQLVLDLFDSAPAQTSDRKEALHIDQVKLGYLRNVLSFTFVPRSL